MSSARPLRLVLYIQAAAVALPIVAAAGVAVDQLINKVLGSCAYGNCAASAPLLVIGGVGLFAGPAWWTISGARRAGRLTSPQLAWLVAVDVYLLVVGLSLSTQARDHLDAPSASFELPTLIAGAGVVFTASVSAVACGARMLQLRRPT